MSEFDCQECGMRCKPTDYHPHLFCTIWRAYHRDPAVFLAEHGYTRGAASEEDIRQSERNRLADLIEHDADTLNASSGDVIKLIAYMLRLPGISMYEEAVRAASDLGVPG